MSQSLFILGVDAAWTFHNPSGVALLEVNAGAKPQLVHLARSYSEFLQDEICWEAPAKITPPQLSKLLEYCQTHYGDVQVLALDIPLGPQPVRSCREADRAVTRQYGGRGASVHSPTPERPGPVADLLYQQLTEAGFQWTGLKPIDDHPSFLEVYPHIAIIELFGYGYRLPYKVQKRNQYFKEDPPEIRYKKSVEKLNELRARILTEVSLSEKINLPDLDANQDYSMKYLKGYEDALDSIICALVGYYYSQGEAVALGDEIGTIWAPRPKRDRV
jgi:predicted RNase H-like nuclease